MDIALYRQFYADEVAAVCCLASSYLIEALARIERERFLPAGPWLVRGEADAMARTTPDADPRHVYHNYSIAIDAGRHLFNGAPGAVARLVDALGIGAGGRVLHIGAGLGYYTAVMAHMVGATGRVVAYEADAQLAEGARRNFVRFEAVDVCCGPATSVAGFDGVDAVLVSAGVTHPLECWLDAVRPGGRLAIPLTVAIPAMGPLGKGITVLLTKKDSRTFDARAMGMTAIYSAVDIRDAAANEAIGRAMQRLPFPRLGSFTTAPHECSSRCWLHTDRFCLSEQ